MAQGQPSFLKENFQFVYSLILIIFIPVAIIANTLWGIQNTQKNMDVELQRKAALAEEVFAGSVSDSLSNHAGLQTKIDQIMKGSGEVKEISTLGPENNGYLVVASSDKKNIGLVMQSSQNTIAWIENKSIATLVSDTSKTPNTRYWVVITPLLDTNGQKVALVDMKVSLTDIDALSKKTLTWSLVFLIITIFIVLLLLVNHFRFFEYAVLFK